MWYLGTADAVTQNIDIVDSYDVDYVLILAGDHIYKMDYEIMLRQHVETGADVTVGCLTVPREEATAFGVMAVDKDDQITDFLENPPIRRAPRTTRQSRSPRWASTSSTPGNSCAIC
jgi:glucose-1-phosphate adenylyltransferase